MSITSFQFFAFVISIIVAYNLRPSLLWRQAILLTANLFFLASFASGPTSLVPITLFLGFGYLSLRLIQQKRRRLLFIVSVPAFILAFVWLKRYTFLPPSTFLKFPYLTIGLSYIFFRVLHLIIDAHQESLSDRVDLISFLTYTLNFTTLISGPIQWYQDFALMQLAEVRPPLTIIIAGRAVERLIIGVFKLAVISAVFALIQSSALKELPTNQNLQSRIQTGSLIAVAYPLYLYFNFSGYTDIMIGIARFLRLTLPENFDRPFSSLDFIEFWSRWHITLSTWLKTYVYTPLVKKLMSRSNSANGEMFAGVTGFFVTFFLIGVWHGQTSAFIFFGVLQGLGVSVNKLYQIQMTMLLRRKRYRAISLNPIYRAAARGLTFTWFTFTLLWFWSDWGQISWMTNSLGLAASASIWIVIFVGASVILARYEVFRNWALSLKVCGIQLVLSRYVRTAWSTALATVTLVLVSVSTAPTPDVVYKIF